jgi:C4-type Zn-finger protein
MTKLRRAQCPSCGKDITVTYWPYNIPLYTAHTVPDTERDCRFSLRPVVSAPAKD